MRILKTAISFVLILLVFSCFLTVCAEETGENDKKQVSISFDSMGGSECETIYGYAGETKISADMLPTPVKDGYTFKGWRHFNEYGAPFELEVFPNYDITLVASFEPNGFITNFEGSINSIYDYNSGIELYGTKTEGYRGDAVKSGWNCLRTVKGDKNPMFLVSYYNALEVGYEYELTIWLFSDNKSTKGDVDLIYVQNPDVREEPLGYHKAFEIDGIRQGEWIGYKIKFVAAAPYIIIRMPNKGGIYIEDVGVEKTGTTGELPKLKKVGSNLPLPKHVMVIIGVISLICTIVFLPKMKSRLKG